MDNLPPQPQFYLTPKDETPIKGIVIYSVVLLFAIIILSNLYSYINIYLPFRVVRTLLPFFYAWIIGYIMSWGFFLGKIKGMKNIILLAFIGTIISTYLLWCIWTAVVLNEPMFSKIGSLFQGIEEIDVQGVLIRGKLLGGAILAKVLWVLSTLVIFFVPIFIVDEKPPTISNLKSFMK